MVYPSYRLLSVLIAGELGRFHIGRNQLRLSILAGWHLLAGELCVHHLDAEIRPADQPCVPLTASLVDGSQIPTSRTAHRVGLSEG
jgi:hypothetical protein